MFSGLSHRFLDEFNFKNIPDPSCMYLSVPRIIIFHVGCLFIGFRSW